MNVVDEHKNEILLVRKAQKDKKYFGEIYEKFRKKIRIFITRKVSSDDLAEDLTSQVFEKALKNLDRFRWQGVSLGCWLYKIARNTVYDYYRSARRKRVSNLDEDIPIRDENVEDLDSGILHDEKELQLYSVISQLDHKDQQLLYYKYFEGLNNKQISKELGLSQSNVATRLHRIRKKMKDLFPAA